ncbi:MAG: ribosomal protein S18-alanine N-acetyltransferase [Candidatus Marinimicrobia bacterium]|nr:ribosomal protein S18-alanine N-acetyltransferase [Candidatus Neomarinimicrobiota bacterium]
MNIRASEETDLARILQIENSVFQNSAWTRAMISDELTLNVDRKTWVIDSNIELVGYCMLRYGPNEVHLVNMAVDPSLQKMGIGKKLLIHFLDNIPKDSSAYLEVKRGNFPAIKLYLNAGFKDIAIREDYYPDGEDAIVMCLNK